MAQKTKDQLLAEARDQGLSVNETMTNAELQTALDEAPDTTSGATPAATSGTTHDDADKGVADTLRDAADDVEDEDDDSPSFHAAAAEKIIDALTHPGVPRDFLVRLSTALSGAIAGRGQDAVPATGPSEKDRAMTLPVNSEATTKMSAAKAAAQITKSDNGENDGVEIEESDVAAFSVRQATGPDGKPLGDAFVVVATNNGKKHAAAL